MLKKGKGKGKPDGAVWMHHIATCLSVLMSGWLLVRGTGSRIRDCLAGVFLVTQLFALLKIAAEASGRMKETMEERVRRLKKTLDRHGKCPVPSEVWVAALTALSLLFKIGVPLFLADGRRGRS